MSEQRVVWKSVLWALGVSLVHCMAALVVAMVLISCVPRYIKLFEDYDVDLPAATLLVVYISEMAVNYWYTILVPLALDCLLLIGLSLAPPKVRWLARAWSDLVLASAFLLLAFAFLAVSLPFEGIRVALPDVADTEGPASEAIEPAGNQPLPGRKSQADAEP